MSNGAMLIISISSANTRANPSERGIGTWVFVAAPSCCRALHHQVQGSAGHQAPGSAGLTIFDHGFPMFSNVFQIQAVQAVQASSFCSCSYMFMSEQATRTSSFPAVLACPTRREPSFHVFTASGQ